VLAGLLAATLIWAYWVAHPAKNRPSGADQAFALWEVPPQKLSRVTVQASKRRLILEPEPGGEGGGSYVWIQSEPLDAVANSAPGAEEPAESRSKPPTQQFKGNRSAEQALELLATLMVQRRIGKLEELENPLQYGLPAESDFLELEREGADPLRLNLGGGTYGDTYRYVHFVQDGSVYLVRQTTLQGLTRSPLRMMDRDLFPFPLSSATRLELRMGDRTASFYRLETSAADSAEWGDSPEAEAGDESVKAWVTDLSRLKVMNYVGREDLSGGEPALEAVITAEANPSVTLRWLAQEGEHWMAVSSHTRHAVRLNAKAAGALVDGAKALLEGP
jgi:hypothetical protein